MGKYIKKGKASGEVAVMEVAAHRGVLTRTRARSLAAAAAAAKEDSVEAPASYLQLRSRRLEKPSAAPRPPKESPRKTSCPTLTPSPSLSPMSSKRSARSCSSRMKEDDDAAEVEASFGENVLEAEVRDRDARETTPCSLIRDPESIGTPGSTTRPSNSATNRRVQNSLLLNIPTTHEMEEFFSGAEQQQQRIFTEKYNFDPVNDQPLPGRYEWVKLDL